MQAPFQTGTPTLAGLGDEFARAHRREYRVYQIMTVAAILTVLFCL